MLVHAVNSLIIKQINDFVMSIESITTYIIDINTKGDIDINKGPFRAVLFDANQVKVAEYEFDSKKLNTISSLSYEATNCRIKWYDGEKVKRPTMICKNGPDCE